MTLEEIIKEAEEKYKREKGDCRLTLSMKKAAKLAYIEKLKKRYENLSSTNTPN